MKQYCLTDYFFPVSAYQEQARKNAAALFNVSTVAIQRINTR